MWHLRDSATGIQDPVARRQAAARILVPVTAGAVTLGSSRYELEGEAPPDGTVVQAGVWGEGLVVRALEPTVPAEPAPYAGPAKRVDPRERDAQRRAYAARFNAGLNVPVAWRTGYKPVLSGLSARSSGSGMNRATVAHVELLEPLTEGRLARQAGDFLCGGDKGRGWTLDSHLQVGGTYGEPYDPPVSCKACLRIARRWQGG